MISCSRPLLALVLASLLLPSVAAQTVIHVGREDVPLAATTASVTIDCASGAGSSTSGSLASGIYVAVAVGACFFRASTCDVSTGYFRLDCSAVSAVAPTCDIQMDGQCLLGGGAGEFYHGGGAIHGQFVDTNYADNSGAITVYYLRIPS